MFIHVTRKLVAVMVVVLIFAVIGFVEVLSWIF